MMWLEWACDEDVETVWIREDLARLNDPALVPDLADAVGLGSVWPHLRLVFDRAEPMILASVEGTIWDEGVPGVMCIQQAHEEETGDVMLYRRYYATEDPIEPGEVVFGEAT